MRVALHPHPATPCVAVAAIAVAATRPEPRLLRLSYAVSGDIARLYVPPRAEPARTDELWRRTCFEAFVRAPDGAGYIELNFSPSTEWAAYRFAGYREGMAPVAELGAPTIEPRVGAAELRLDVALDLGPVAELPPTGAWLLALTAVIEARDGALSYWSAAHPTGRPDFHSAAGFVVELPAP